MAMTIAILIALGAGLVAGVLWGILLERDARVRFGAPHPLPVAYTVTDAKLDITSALKRSERK